MTASIHCVKVGKKKKKNMHGLRGRSLISKNHKGFMGQDDQTRGLLLFLFGCFSFEFFFFLLGGGLVKMGEFDNLKQ